MSSRPDGPESTLPPHATAPRTVGTSPARYDDEVSLRELYLILRRGTPLIVAVTLAALVIGAVVGYARPRTFEAEAVIEYTPATLITGGDNASLQFDPTTGLSFPAYTSLTRSSAVMRTVLEAGGEAVDGVDGVAHLRERLEAERVSGPDQASQLSPLTVTHRASAGRPDAAAALAEAWAAASLDAVRAWVLNGHADPDAAERAERDAVQGALDAARAELEAFRVRDDRNLLEARLSGLIQRAAATDARIEELRRDLASAEARSAALAADGAAASEAGIEAAAHAAGLAASLDAARADAAAYADDAADLRARLVRLDGEADRLEATVARAEAAVAEAGGGSRLRVSAPRVRLLSEPVPPTSSAGTSPLVVAFVAGLVAMLGATLFVFLREAVREPAAA